MPGSRKVLSGLVSDHLDRDVVGLMMDHTPNLPIGLLAILKSGRGFVPIDPAYPDERIDFILEDCGIEVLLTELRWKSKALQIAKRNLRLRRVVCVEEVIAARPDVQRTASTGVPEHSTTRPGPAAGRRLAYIIYTSGSTGLPKGVPITHRNLVPTILWSRDCFRLSERTRVLQNLSFSFDFGVYELLTTLSFGGTLYFINRKELSQSRYGRFIQEHRINTLHSTPSFFAGFIAGKLRLESLDLVHLGGEQLTRACAEEVFRVAGENCVLYNGYGPTEASVNSNIFAVGDKRAWDSSDDLISSKCVPIGRPSASNRIFVLDKNVNPVPIGVPGELHIGGPGLSEGYLNRPGLTAERFIPDPFTNEPGTRLYKTGDLVRYLGDGNIEFLSRIDHQVKVRGFRIELGEIESALCAHPAVREAVVTVREDHPGDKRLVAYIEAGQGQLEVAELRTYVQGKLPDYQVPSSFVTLEAIPLTSNGKVDRQALLALRSEPGRSITAPRTVTEELLSSLWENLLNVEQVGVEDNFFYLGGHSLSATQLMSRISDTFKLDLPLQSLFEGPTVVALAARIDAALRNEPSCVTVPIRSASAEGPYPVSSAQQRLWFFEHFDPGTPTYNIPVAIRLSAALNRVTLEHTINEIVRRHSILRTTFSSSDGQPVQTVAQGLRLPCSLVDLSALDETDIEASAPAKEEAARPFDVSRGPLLRATLLNSDRESMLLLTMHHIVSDGWSMKVFFSELGEIYAAFASGQRSLKAELSIQYADFAQWQQEWLQGEKLKSELAYWKRQLTGAPALSGIPTDRPRPQTQSYRGAIESLPLSRSVSDAVETLSQKAGTTLFMTLITAFKALLCCYSGRTDIVVGTTVANRNRSEIEPLIGFFVNTLPLRTSLEGDPTLVELLARVRETALGAYTHQDLPFERLIEELRPDRDIRHTPFVQVAFQLVDDPMTVRFAGFVATPEPIDPGASQFELTLGVKKTGQGLLSMIQYNPDLFDQETMTGALQHYHTLVQGLTEDPNQRLSDLLSLISTGNHQARRAVQRLQRDDAGPRDVKADILLRKSRLSVRRAGLSAEKRAKLEQQMRGE